MKDIFGFFLLILIIIVIPDVCSAYQGVNWSDLQELLKLDSDEIQMSWDEFQLIMRQAGGDVQTDVSLKEGVVTLKRDQFRRILSQMKPIQVSPPTPPCNYIITKSRYTGQAGQMNAWFTAIFTVYVFDRGGPVQHNIPVIHSLVALEDLWINNEPAVIVTKNNWHHVSVTQSGYHEIKAIFSVDQGDQLVNLSTVRAMINQVDFTLPDDHLGLQVSPAIHTRIHESDAGSHLTGYLPPTSSMTFRWASKTEPREKRPARFNANLRTIISVDRDILRAKTWVDLEIIQNSLTSVSLQLPDDYEVVKVEGHALSEWRVRETDIGSVLEIPFLYEIHRGNMTFSVQTEKMLGVGALAATYPGLQVIDAVRESGEIAVIAESAIEVQVQESFDLNKMDYLNLPQWILSESSRPILFAFFYSKHPYELDISITQHERMEGISTIIESAHATALYLSEGKLLYQIIYSIRNTYKQFMEMELPPHASIWTVYVDGKRGKPSRNEQGKILIPLVRSTGNGDHARPFDVELIYTQPILEFGIKSDNACALPRCDIFTNKVELNVYVPEGYHYDFDDGEWDLRHEPKQNKSESIGFLSEPAPKSGAKFEIPMEEEEEEVKIFMLDVPDDDIESITQSKEPSPSAMAKPNPTAPTEDADFNSYVNPWESPIFIPYETPPQIIGKIKPIYPLLAQEAGIEGKVILNVYIDIDGSVKNVLVMKGVPNTGLDEAAIAAVKQCRYEPALQRGKPVGVWISQVIKFELDGEKKSSGYGAENRQALMGPIGVNSVKVHLPLSGLRYKFEKKVVDQDETFPLKFSYTGLWLRRAVTNLISLFIVLIGSAIAVLNRHRITPLVIFVGRFIKVTGEVIWGAIRKKISIL